MNWHVRREALRDAFRSMRIADFDGRVSMVANGAHVDAPSYERWLKDIGQPHGRHRKVWEWCFILEALSVRDLLRPGVSAVGFGVGTEPMVAALAARGLRVLATDQAAEHAGAWGDSGQHASAIGAVQRPDLCDPAQFAELVDFRPVDMRSIPTDLRGFDVAWSSCCFEHLGSPDAGFDFVVESMRVLVPGGTAVHTTEIDCSGGPLLETGTVAHGDYACFYRRQDLRRLVARLRAAGHVVDCNYRIGHRHPLETSIDVQPYTHDPHLRLRVGDRVVSSFGLVVTKGPRQA
jgi:hypothetical protein